MRSCASERPGCGSLNEVRPMNLFDEYVRYETRRQFLSRGKNALGMAAMASLLGGGGAVARGAAEGAAVPGHLGSGRPGLPHYAAKAKHVIYLHMVGGPSQLDLYDYKPQMQAMFDKDLPESIRKGQRLTTMTSGQARFPV